MSSRFYGQLILSVSLIAVGGFVAWHADNFRQEQSQTEQLFSYLTQTLAEMHTNFADQTQPAGLVANLGQGKGNRFVFQIPNSAEEIMIQRFSEKNGEALYFGFRLAALSDSWCALLLKRFPHARARVFKMEEGELPTGFFTQNLKSEALKSDGSTKCGTNNKGDNLNAVELLFSTAIKTS